MTAVVKADVYVLHCVGRGYGFLSSYIVVQEDILLGTNQKIWIDSGKKSALCLSVNLNDLDYLSFLLFISV